MAKRLSGMDAVTLSMESATTPAHTVALAILDASDELSHDRLHESVRLSLLTMARFRSRLVEKPLGWGQPVWAEIDDFDPNPHLRRVTVPDPGGRQELGELIAGLSTQPLSRCRPLWEVWSIDGLEAGRWALALKLSPAIAGDAAGLTAVWQRLLRTGSRGGKSAQFDTEPKLGAPPAFGGLVADTIQEVLSNQRFGATLVASAVHARIRALRPTLSETLPHTPSSMRGPVPRTAFNEALTKRRAVAFATVPLAQVTAVARAFGGSANNVVLAACTLSLRAWLGRHFRVPDHPLSMQIPLSPQRPSTAGHNNRFTLERLRFPVQLDDPVRILTDLHTATEKLRLIRREAFGRTAGAPTLADVAPLVAPGLVRVGMQLYTGLGMSARIPPISQGIVSTIPGLRVPLYCAGVRVFGMYAAAPLMQSAGLNITLVTYGTVVHITVTVCPDRIPAAHEIADGISDSVGILVAAAKDSPRGVSPSVVTELTSFGNKNL